MKTKHLFLFAVLVFCQRLFSQIPQLNSDPNITNKVIYLDFNGQVVSGTLWNSGNTINALASTISTLNMIQVWKRVSEDFRPFDVNVTTDSVRFNNATTTLRTRVVITPTSAWYGTAGGVAYLNSFSWGGTPGTPCWVFENQLGYNAKYIAEACSHEAGHTLSLRHQSTYSVGCVKTAEYNPGQGTGVTGWAPIMGVGYYKNVTTWFNGTSSSSCTTIQYDHGSGSPGITGANYLSFLPDDVGDNYLTGKTLNLVTYNLVDSGIITTPTDVDVYKFNICNTRDITIAAKPWALDTTAYNGANLDVRFQLFNSANTLIATDTLLTKLNTLSAVTLTPGDYYFTIDGGGSANYSDYGSIGKYYLNIKTTDPPFITNTIVASPTTCVGQSTSFSATSNAAPVYWLWNFAGTSPTISIISTPVMVFNSAGIYTVSLHAFNNLYASCVVTQTINVGALPTVTASADKTICPGTGINLNAGGTIYYNWLPGNLAGPIVLVSPSVTTVYTVTGSNGMCGNQAQLTVSVTPTFTVGVVSGSTLLCFGQTTTLTASGANTYTFYPGAMIGSTVTVAPVQNTNYSVTGSNGFCTKSSSRLISVSPDFILQLNVGDTLLCEGENLTMTASGAVNYTFYPGGITVNPAILTPTATTEYTITGSNADNCVHQATAILWITICEGVTHIENSGADINIYPVPASAEIMIVANRALLKIEVVNVIGQVLYEQQQGGQKLQVDVASWPNGVYLLRVHFNNNKTATRKVIVQH
ncbi:MAG: T9SS type A sorting domain-containing protein [Bacteroidota bacterium]